MNINTIFLNPYLLFFLGMILLYWSSEIIIKNSSIISKHFNVSKLLIGVFIMAFGTSLPELFVSISAIINESNPIVIGNIIGSNIANIGLVFGLSIFLKPVIVDKNKNLYYNLFCLCASSLLFPLFLSNSNLIFSEGIILIFFCMIYLYILLKFFTGNNNFSESNNSKYNLASVFYLLIGFVLIYLGSDLFVNGALGISQRLGVKDLAVGMTIVSIGTSAPELFTTVLAIKNNESDLALGNIIGSNIFNITLVGGISSLIKNIKIDFFNISEHSIYFILLLLLFIFSLLLFKKLNRIIGFLFISIYLVFIVINF